MRYLLDTHTFIWSQQEPSKLPTKVRALLERGRHSDQFLLSAISIWEFAKLVEKGRLSLAIDGAAWIERALEAMPGLELVPLSPQIAWQSTCLPRPFHDDPADQIIVATARVEEATLLTRDAKIAAYPHVKTLWS